MKKFIAVFMVFGLLLTACGNNSESTSKDESIIVYTRDSSSGTRGAFEELVGFEGELTSDAIETSGNGDMATKVGNDPTGIGYVSLSTDFDVNNIVGLDYDGVIASEETVLDGSYELARPFSYSTRASGDFDSTEKEQLVLAFLDFLNNSVEGRDILSSEGVVVSVDGAKPWSKLKENHPVLSNDNSGMVIKLGGSTSVEDSIVAVYEAFEPYTNGATFEANLTGSGDGYKRVLGEEKDGANYADIGFASRDFKDSEDVSSALESGVFAKDAIVVVISKDNTSGVNNLTKEQVYDIYTGAIKNWSEL